MHAIARHLPDFAAPRPRGSEPAAPGRPSTPQPPAIDLAEIKREAMELGRREGEAAARAEFEAQRAQDEERFAQRLVAERAAWCAAQSEPLSAAMRDGLAALEAALCEQLARIVGPFLKDAVRQGAMAELETLMVPLLAREDRPVLKVSGPADLIDALRIRLGDPGACLFEPADMPDVRVVAGETVLETQISAWLDRLGSSVT